jgi:predicted DNA binding CopG/RHH family protein
MKTKLRSDEQEIEDAFEEKGFRSVVEGKKAIATYRKAAAATLKKDKRINIRISSRDLEEIRRRAAEEGLPYQTLIASILHKYASGSLTSVR